MKSCLPILIAVFSLVVGLPAKAAVSPLSIGILPPVQFPPGDFDVAGVRASILWGEHRSLYGFDFGLIGNITDVNFAGMAVSGIFNITHSTTNVLGIQAAGFTNVNTAKTTITGIQVALGVNENVTNTTLTGFQIAGLANLSSFTTVRGFQVALFNKAQDVYGFQIGLVNVAQNVHGLQIGIINFNDKGLFAVSPILNFGF